MIKFIKTKDGIKVTDLETGANLSESFEKVVEDPDFENFYVGENIWGDFVLFSKNGELVYTFAGNDEVELSGPPVGMKVLIGKIAQRLQILETITAYDFFADEKIKEELKEVYRRITETEIKNKLAKGEDFTYDLACKYDNAVESINYFFDRCLTEYNKNNIKKERQMKKSTKETEVKKIKPKDKAE